MKKCLSENLKLSMAFRFLLTFYRIKGLVVVRVWGLEPQRISAQEPKSCMSANSIIPAYRSN